MNLTVMKDTKGPNGPSEFRRGLRHFLRSYATSLTVLTYVLAVFVSHFVLGHFVFACPCNYNDIVMTSRASNSNDLTELHQRSLPEERLFYTLSFFIWPALVGWVIALVINGHTKRCLMNSRPHCDCNRDWYDVIYLLRQTGITVIVPLMWIVLSLLDGRYYECMMSPVPGPCLPTKVGQQQVLVALEKENHQLRTFAQALGFTVLGAAFVFTMLVLLCCQFVSRKTYYEDQYMNLYRQKEQEAFSEVSEELIDQEVAKNWRTFFRKARRKSDWEEVTLLSLTKSTEIDEKVIGSALAFWCHNTSKPPSSQAPRPPPPGALNDKDKDALSATWVEVEDPGKQTETSGNDKADKEKDTKKRQSITRDYAIVSNKDLLAAIMTETKPKHSVRFNDEKDKKQDDNNNSGIEIQNNYDPVEPAYCIPQKATSKSVAVQAAPDTPLLKRREAKKINEKTKASSHGHADYDNHIFKQNEMPRLSTLSEASTTSGLSTISTYDYESPDSEDSDLSLTSVTTTSSSIQFISTANDEHHYGISRPSLPQKPSNVVNAQGVNSTVVKKGYVQTLIERQNSHTKDSGEKPERSQSVKKK